MPGPIATTATSAAATWRATASAENTDTASKSPPNACPYVTVASSELPGGQLRDEVGQREWQPGPIGHDVDDSGVGCGVLDGRRDRGELAVQRGGDDRHPVDRLDVGQRLEVLLGAADVGLQARVPPLDDVPGPPLAPRGAFEVPVHDVPATGAQPELDGRGVDDHPIAGGDVARQLGQDVRRVPARRPGRPRRAAARARSSRSRRTLPVRNEGTSGAGYSDAINRSTRSSRDLNGSLQSTVRWAWSFSFRWTQSTV